MISCSPSEKALYECFGGTLLLESSITYKEELYVPVIGEGYQFIQFYIPQRIMKQLEEDRLSFNKMEIVQIDRPTSIKEYGPINKDYMIDKGIIIHNREREELIIVDYKQRLISYLLFID